jgi:competence protein ComEC
MRNKKLTFFILIGIVFSNIVAWSVVYNLNKSRPFEVVFFDVGQGDSIFVETPQKQQILVDGGPDSSILGKLAKEMPFYDRTIDLIILTHPERDHMFGLMEVLKKYKVDNILWTGIVRETPEWKEWNKLIKKEGAKIRIAKAGQKITLSDSFINVLYPIESLEGRELKSTNNTSIVCKLVFNKTSFLFTGDIEKPAEQDLANNNGDLNSDVLKVAHHGSKTSSSSRFLEKVSPKIAVISVGADKTAKGEDCGNKKRNRYGHPNCGVLARLKNFAIQVLRTDQNGDIKIVSDGKNLTIK